MENVLQRGVQVPWKACNAFQFIFTFFYRDLSQMLSVKVGTLKMLTLTNKKKEWELCPQSFPTRSLKQTLLRHVYKQKHYKIFFFLLYCFLAWSCYINCTFILNNRATSGVKKNLVVSTMANILESDGSFLAQLCPVVLFCGHPCSLYYIKDHGKILFIWNLDPAVLVCVVSPEHVGQPLQKKHRANLQEV